MNTTIQDTLVHVQCCSCAMSFGTPHQSHTISITSKRLPLRAECSATVWIEGDGGSAAIKCQLRDGHEGEHERSGTTEFGKHWHLIWSVDS